MSLYEWPHELSNNFCPSTLFDMKTRVTVKYFVIDCLWKPFFILTHTDPFKFNSFDNFANSKAFRTVLT